MIIYNNIEEIKNRPSVVLTLGSFDGLHLAHLSIIDEVKKQAQINKAESLVITFEPHPRIVLDNNSNFKILTQIDEKITRFKHLSIDYLLILKFNELLYKLSAEDFIKELYKYLDIKAIVIGYNHTFGKNQEGNFHLLQKLSLQYKFCVYQLKQVDIGNKKISSSIIRKLLYNGNIQEANKLLGYTYFFTGTVIYGDQLGRKIGFPTANLRIKNENKLIPSDACYVVKVKIKDKILDGMMYIGNRPTVNGVTYNIEVNIFDFDCDIYGEELTVYVLDYLREDIKFANLELLIDQLNIDKANSISFLQKLQD